MTTSNLEQDYNETIITIYVLFHFLKIVVTLLSCTVLKDYSKTGNTMKYTLRTVNQWVVTGGVGGSSRWGRWCGQKETKTWMALPCWRTAKIG